MSDVGASCLFCRIVAGEIPSDRVHEDHEVVAFRDVAPQAPVHVLAVPRRHVRGADALTDEHSAALAACFAALRSVAAAENLGRGYRIVTNVGEDGGQSVPHLHFHLLGGRRLGWPPG